METIFRDGPNSHSSRQREFTPMAMADAASKSESEEATTTKTVPPTVIPISSSTDMKPHPPSEKERFSSSEVKKPSSFEVEAPLAQKAASHETTTEVNATESESRATVTTVHLTLGHPLISRNLISQLAHYPQIKSSNEFLPFWKDSLKQLNSKLKRYSGSRISIHSISKL